MRYYKQRGNRVAHKQYKEQNAQHEHLPSSVLVVADMVQRVRIVCLKHVTDEQERQQEAEPAPHPRVEALNGDVHVVAFAERFQSVQNALLIAELQILNHADVCIKVHELVPEQLPSFALWPNQQHTGTYGRNEVVRAPPAFDARTVYLKNGLSNRERAIVPDQQKQKRQLERTLQTN